MRALVLGLHYPPHHVGGYEVSCHDVVVRLAERGHHLAVLTSTLRRPGVGDPVGEADAATPVWRDLEAWFRDDDLYAPGPAARWRAERRSQRALAAALDRWQPEVVFAWQLGALSLGLLTTVARRGLPVVYAVSDDWLSYAPELDAWSRSFRRWPSRARRLAGRVLGVPTEPPDLAALGPFCFISEDTRRRAATYGSWSLEDSTIVYSGIDGTRFEPGPADTRDRWGGRLLYVGRYDPRKGIETAIRSLPRLPGTTLEVQGTGDPAERRRLEGLVADLDLAERVTFGACTRAELPDRYRAADALVFPSEWEEPFGLTPLEAMACATPVIATGVGGSDEFLIDGQNCVRFTPGDPAALAAAVERLATDAGLRRSLVARGLSTAAVFDADRLADAFEAWLHHLAGGRRTPRPEARSFLAEVAHAWS